MVKLIGIVLGVGLFVACLKAADYIKRKRKIKLFREGVREDMAFMIKGREIIMPSALNCDSMIISNCDFNRPIQLPSLPEEGSLQASEAEGTSLLQGHQQPQKPQEPLHE